MKALGEVTAAIMLTAAFAVAAATLYGVFQENLGVAETMMSTRTDKDRLRASELIGIGPGQCGAGFLLYNYGHTSIPLNEMAIYNSSGTTLMVSFRDLDGDIIHTLYAGNATWVVTTAIPCDTSIVMVTPAGQTIRLRV